jgi:WD40 repeat protein
VLLALEAVSTTHAVGEPVTPEAVDALHQAVHASRVRFTLPGSTDHVDPGSTDHVDQVPAAVAISPDGRHLFIASTDGTDGAVTVKVWDVASGQEKQPLLNRTNQITEIAFSPDGRHLATASADGTVNLRDTDSGREVLSLSGYTSQITEITFSPDGRHLVTAREDGTVNLWDTDSGRAVFALAGYTDQLLAVACSPDGKFLATAREDGTVKVWDVASGQEKRPLLGRTDQITKIAFSPNGRYLATASADRTVKVWDVDAGIDKPVLIVSGHTSRVIALAFIWNETRLVAASLNRMFVYPLELKDLIALARMHVTRWWTVEECQRYLQKDKCPSRPF